MPFEEPTIDAPLPKEKVYIAYRHPKEKAGKPVKPSEIEISRKVYEQYEAVRLAGICNMFDRHCVQRFAFDEDMFELVDFIGELRHGPYLYLLKNYADIRAFYKDVDPVLPTTGEAL